MLRFRVYVMLERCRKKLWFFLLISFQMFKKCKTLRLSAAVQPSLFTLFCFNRQLSYNDFGEVPHISFIMLLNIVLQPKE